MPRKRKCEDILPKQQMCVWKIGKYIRLSREDGNVVSESVVNQDKILDDEIPNFFKDGLYEVVDTYIDDGTSGTSDIEREDFQRLVRDVTTGRINCIMVKNLSRAFRNSSNQGKFLEEFIPLYNTRFISLFQPRIDTSLDPEIVHSLEVSITGFINEQYAYKTSVDVRNTFRTKRKNGEFIGAFAPYGWMKDPENKNYLLVDEEAAQVRRDILKWKFEGMSVAGIRKHLNELGVPNPTTYKRSKGFRYKNPHATDNDGLWTDTQVSRMIKDPANIGVLVQGKQKVVSYKVHSRASVPEKDWFVVENAIPPLVDQEFYEALMAMEKRDTRTAPDKREVYLFSGFLRCWDCKAAMTRRTAKERVYYACRTYTGKQHCTKHTIRLDILEQVTLVTVQKQIELVATLSDVIDAINKAPAVHNESARIENLLKARSTELDKSRSISDGLYMDWKSGEISHDQYRRMKVKLDEQVSNLQEIVERLKHEQAILAKGFSKEDPYLTTFLKYRNIQSLNRTLLIELVDTIYVHENGEIEIEFKFADQYRRIIEFINNNQNELYYIGGEAVS